MPDRFLSDAAMDYTAIYGRGAGCCGDEDFALYMFLCCGGVRLVCYEDDTVYLDPRDLSRQGSSSVSSQTESVCPLCGVPVSVGQPYTAWATWGQAAASPWAWTIRPDAWPQPFR